MDNRYQCAQLAVLLRDKYQVYSVGTTRQNRIGWNKQLMNLTVKDERGSLIRKYDPNNHILFIQWKDNKVVNVISSLGDSGITTVTRRIGSEERTVQCEENIKKYVDKMNGVDLVDYHAKIGGGLARIGHYKKWYKKVHHAVTDFMIHQGRVGWNMSTINSELRRNQLTTWEFQAVLAEEFISYVDETQLNRINETAEANAMELVMGGHRATSCLSKRAYCNVCRIEENIISRLELEKKKSLEGKVSTRAMEEELSWQYDLGPSSRTQTHLCSCAKEDCTLICHVVRTESNHRMIFSIDQFRGMSCFEIGHVLLNEGLFHCNSDVDAKQRVSVRTGHPIWLRLREMYGMQDKKRKRNTKKKKIMQSDDESSSSSSSSSNSVEMPVVET